MLKRTCRLWQRLEQRAIAWQQEEEAEGREVAQNAQQKHQSLVCVSFPAVFSAVSPPEPRFRQLLFQ